MDVGHIGDPDQGIVGIEGFLGGELGSEMHANVEGDFVEVARPLLRQNGRWSALQSNARGSEKGIEIATKPAFATIHLPQAFNFRDERRSIRSGHIPKHPKLEPEEIQRDQACRRRRIIASRREPFQISAPCLWSGMRIVLVVAGLDRRRLTRLGNWE